MRSLNKTTPVTLIIITALLALSAGLLIAANYTTLGTGFAVAADGDGDGDGGGNSNDPCGPPGPGNSDSMSGDCGCDGSTGGGYGGDGDGDGDHGGGGGCTTFSCISAANICGNINTGTQNSCTGICSASVPANPSGSCSIATPCGVNATGFNGCGGNCNITQYPFCITTQNPDGDGGVEWITLGDGDGSGYGATDIVAEIFAKPTLVVQGTPIVVRWLSIETDSCEVTAPNGDSWTGVTGEELSGDIEEKTTYTLECVGFDGTVVVDSVTVSIVPEWEEF